MIRRDTNCRLPVRLIRYCCAWVTASAWLIAAATAADEPPTQPIHVSSQQAGMDADLKMRIDDVVQQALERGEMAGCVVVVGRRAGIVFDEAYGHRSLVPTPVLMTTDTLFDMASLTKPIATATSVMLLVERGQLRLQDKVADYFPEFAARGKQDVTIEQLLVHSAGLIPDNALDDYRHGWDAARLLICDLEPLAQPGTTFKYSDIGFILLGKIVESVSGKPLDEFTREEIFVELGMDETSFLPPDELMARAAATEKRDGRWLTGEVHDPRAALLGGVAGHAGLFSTARDLAVFAHMMLGEGRCGDVRLLAPATVVEMIRPRDIGGQLRSLGWDSRSAYSRNRGELMSGRAFGHGGFTGTAMWIDPELDLYVIFLSNRLHPDGQGEVNSLAGRIGTIACGAIQSTVADAAPARVAATRRRDDQRGSTTRRPGKVLLGIEVIAANEFGELGGKRVGLITNHTGRDGSGTSTAERLHEAKNVELVALFSPEHGIGGTFDTADIGDSVDAATGVPVYSLYGESRQPTIAQLARVDALVFDIQDVGTRFYTYVSTMGLAMEAAAKEGKQFVVLDRPNPIGGEIVEGPLLDAGRESFTGYHRIPVRHGLTIGELAFMIASEKQLDLNLTVVPMQGWQRSMYLFDTGMAWVNPSPNMRSLTEAVLYPGIGLLETTNVSVGRGTDTPFEVLGAPWIRERELAEFINRAGPPGARAVPVRFTPTSSKFTGEECGGVNFVITDWQRFRSFELGLVVARGLRMLHRDDWQAEPYLKLLGNDEVFQRVLAGDEVGPILEAIAPQLDEFRQRKRQFELYQ